MKKSQLVQIVKEQLSKSHTINEDLDAIMDKFIQTDDSTELKAYIRSLPDRARTKLAKMFKIELDEEVGYSKYAPGGTTKGGTTDDFRNILTAIAKGDHKEGDPVRGNKILDKANPENVARITRGEKPIYEQELQQATRQQAIEYVKNNDAKQYSIDQSRGVAQRFLNKQDAIDALSNSNYDNYEIMRFGDMIRVYIPIDAKFTDMVRSMGRLD